VSNTSCFQWNDKKRPLDLSRLFKVTFLLVSILTCIPSCSVYELLRRIGQIITFDGRREGLFNTLIWSECLNAQLRNVISTKHAHHSCMLRNMFWSWIICAVLTRVLNKRDAVTSELKSLDVSAVYRKIWKSLNLRNSDPVLCGKCSPVTYSSLQPVLCEKLTDCKIYKPHSWVT